jgi:hopanoid-associated phosphorylase
VITGIVVALPEELDTLTARQPGFKGGKKIAKGECLFINPDLAVVYSGAGPCNAKAAAEQLVSQGAERLISWGCAAALSAALRPGALVLADDLISENGRRDANSCVSQTWRAHVKGLLSAMVPVYQGALVESARLVASSNEKHRLHAQTGAIAVDMESLAIARIASRRQKAFLAIRAIADPVEMDLPKAVSYSLSEQGEVVLRRLILHLLRNPVELPGLVSLGLDFNVAKKTLKTVAKNLAQVIDF